MQYNLFSTETLLFMNYILPQNNIRNYSTIDTILSHFYKELTNTKKQLNNFPLPYYTITEATLNLYSSHYLPKEICDEIKQKTKYKVTFQFHIDKQSFLLYFFIHRKPTEQKIKLLYNYLCKVQMWLLILMKYATADCKKYSSVSIYIYLTNFKKYIPFRHKDILAPIHVNTAFTSSCSKQTKPAEIIIYRQEEWFKVFIHESFHLFGLDFSGYSSSSLTKCILELFPVKSEVNAYEAYTEFWAEIIHSIFISFFITIDKPTFISTAIFLIETEKKYSFFQMVKVLNHMNMKYGDLYSNIGDNIKKYKENTNVLSYYILKTILLSKWNLFIDWCKENNTNLLLFSNKPEKQLIFCQYIKKYFTSIYFQKELEEANKLYQKIKKEHKYGSEFLLKNLRMTICEIKEK